jgi:hypothetical protein
LLSFERIVNRLPCYQMYKVWRARISVLGILVLFLAPLIGAWVLYTAYEGGWRPKNTKNHGDLVIPPRPLNVLSLRGLDHAPPSADFLRGRWTYIHIGGSECNIRCQRTLYKTRQVRLGQGTNISRVQRVLVLMELPSSAPLKDLLDHHPDLLIVTVSEEAPDAFIGQFNLSSGLRPAGLPPARLPPARLPPARLLPAQAECIYLADPHGNLMMSYPPKALPKGLIKDLEHLLKVSQIG